MTRKEIYTKAAEIVITEKEFACCAINLAENDKYGSAGPNRKKFTKIFEPPFQQRFHTVWWGNIFGRESQENQLARSLALLFMAEMEK